MIPKAISMDFKQIAMLLVFFIAYVIFGGLIFMLIETPFELEQKLRKQESEIEFRGKIRALNLSGEKDLELTQIINSYLAEQGVAIGDDQEVSPDDTTTNWDFFNSFFFAITVVTTIGYGHLSPSTTLGRCFTLVYALFGIPMTGILLGAIGDRFSRCFLNEIHKVRRRRSKYVSTRFMVLKRGLLFFVPWFAVFVILPACIFYCFENWTFLECFYYCFITLSTIGFGDFVAGQWSSPWIWFYKIAVVLWIIFGLAYLSMILNFISQGLRSNRLSHVVHSIRLASPHSMQNLKQGLRGKNHKDKKARDAANNNNNNGSAVFAIDTPTTLTPAPSPTNLNITTWSDTASSHQSSSPMPPKKGKKNSFMYCCSIRDDEDQEEEQTPQSPTESPMTPMTSDILVIVTSSEGTPSHPLAQFSSHSGSNSDCESPSPHTRSELRNSRRLFFQALETDPSSASDV